MDSAGNVLVPGICIKCKTKPAVIDTRYASYCDECFMNQIHHKYRLSVSQSKSNTSCEKILVALEASPSGYALIYLTQLSRLLDPHRRNLDTFHYVFLEKPSCSPRENENEEIKKFLYSLNDKVTYQHTTCGEVLFPQSSEKLNTLMEKCPDPSDFALLKEIIYKLALFQLAIEGGFSKIYIPDTNNDLASEIFTFVCHGKGSSIPWLLSPVQSFLAGNVGIVRPLRDISNVEINYYLERLRETFAIPSNFAEEDNEKSSIMSLTRDFLQHLDEENSSTASTVVRTASKIYTDACSAEKWLECSLCIAPLDKEEKSFCTSCHRIIESLQLEETDSLAIVLPSCVINRLQGSL